MEKLKFEDFVKNAIDGFDVILFVGSLLLVALFRDLGLVLAEKVAGAIFIGEFMWCLCTFFCMVVISIKKKYKEKKKNIGGDKK